MRDGKCDCRNRADEEAFANSSSLLLDLEKMRIPCNTSWLHQGFKCKNVQKEGKKSYARGRQVTLAKG